MSGRSELSDEKVTCPYCKDDPEALADAHQDGWRAGRDHEQRIARVGLVDSEAWSEDDRRDVAAWLRREANQRVHLFPQRRDGVDALLRHLADRVGRPGKPSFGGAA